MNTTDISYTEIETKKSEIDQKIENVKLKIERLENAISENFLGAGLLKKAVGSVISSKTLLPSSGKKNSVNTPISKLTSMLPFPAEFVLSQLNTPEKQKMAVSKIKEGLKWLNKKTKLSAYEEALILAAELEDLANP